MMKKAFYTRLWRTLAYGLAALLLLALALFGPIDGQPYHQTDYYARTVQAIDSLNFPRPDSAPLYAGWAKANITPSWEVDLAGYGVSRGSYTHVHDSLYVRAVFLRKGSEVACIVAADLIVFPPLVTELLARRLPRALGLGIDQVYFSATHTHSGMGGWAQGLGGRLTAGRYQEAVPELIVEAILRAMAQARAAAQPATVGYVQAAAPEYVANRVVERGPTDAWLRCLVLQQANGKRAVLSAYSAHASCVHSSSTDLGRDYPGVLVDALERQDSVDFALFCAGMVGSHNPYLAEDSAHYAMMERVGQGLAEKARTATAQAVLHLPGAMALRHVPLAVGSAQLRIADGWRVRPWAFDALMGERQLRLSVLHIGDAVLLGLPCDFSGVLMPPLAAAFGKQKLNPLITSFNGGYTGYITPDDYYGLHHPEVREMNWVGPGKGAYFVELLTRISQKIASSQP